MKTTGCTHLLRRIPQSYFIWTVSVLVFAFAVLPGCGRPVEESRPSGVPAQSDPSPEPPAPSPAPTSKQIAALPGMTPEKLLRDVLETYARAKYYADDAYVEARYEMTVDGRVREAYDRRPCSVVFQKPNSIRLAVARGLLVSDGEKICGRILLPAYRSEYIERATPLLISSIRDLYTDSRLSGAMDMGVPPNIFWVPPQLVMLLSTSPLKTLLPDNSRLELLEPQELVRTYPENAFPPDIEANTGTAKKEERLVCDRIRINAGDGTRTLWIDRANKTLVRFEFPLEQLEVPENVNRCVRLTMELWNVVVSSELQKVSKDANPFEIKRPEHAVKVSAFLPLAVKICGVAAADVVLRPLASGYSPISLAKPNGLCRVLCFWKRENDFVTEVDRTARLDPKAAVRWAGPVLDYWAESQKYLHEIDIFIKRFDPGASKTGVEFVSVNTDPGTTSTDELVRMQIGTDGTLTSLYRFADEETRKNLLATIGAPSVLVIDQHGIVQRFYNKPVSSATLDRDLKQLARGRKLYEQSIVSFEAKAISFKETVESACEHECYRIDYDSADDDIVVRTPRVMPKSVSLVKHWATESLRHPCNPTPVPLLPETGKTSAPDNAFLVVPCEGNTLAAIDIDGKVTRKVVPKAASGEPITLVRAFRAKDGAVYYAASARRLSKRVHRLDGNFKEIGSLDVGALRKQNVGDLALADADNDGKPELYLGLLGDSRANSMPVHGLYAADMTTQDILWKDESVFEPYRIDVVDRLRGDSGPGANALRILAVNMPDGVAGSIVEDDAKLGRRISEPLLDDGGSIQWFAAESLRPGDPADLAVLYIHPEPLRLFFAGVSREGKILWKNPLSTTNIGWQTDAIIAGDIDGDGVKEWIVTLPDGVILFYAADGRPLDQFQYGAEITGICVANHGDRRFLIVCDVDRVTAWQLPDKK